MCGYVCVGSHLVERGNGSRGVAVQTIAPLDGGDGTLEVRAVQQLRELQEAVAQDEQLGEKKGDSREMAPFSRALARTPQR